MPMALSILQTAANSNLGRWRPVKRGGPREALRATGQGMVYLPRTKFAVVAEWYTRITQNDVGAIPCRFDSDRRHIISANFGAGRDGLPAPEHPKPEQSTVWGSRESCFAETLIHGTLRTRTKARFTARSSVQDRQNRDS